MSTRDSPGGKGGRCVRLTTYHPCSAERQEIRGLNLPGPPWAISTACCGRDLYLYLGYYQGNHPYTSYFWLHISIIHMLTMGCPVHFYDKELQLIWYMQKNLETVLR